MTSLSPRLAALFGIAIILGAARTESEQPAIVTSEPTLTLFRETGQLIDGAVLAHLLLRIDVQDENKALHKAERALKTIGFKTNDSDAVRARSERSGPR